MISCQNNYWLDNNAANCIQCDPNCVQCSSTTRCSKCNDGYYLLSNFTCSMCMSQCLTCSAGSTCSICQNTNYFFNSSSGTCQIGPIADCISYDTSGKCLKCNNQSYLDTSQQCTIISNGNLVSFCDSY